MARCAVVGSAVGDVGPNPEARMAAFERMTSIRELTVGFWRKVLPLLRNRRASTPIDSVASLEDFVSTRAAYVGQKTLYGYVKTRMGIRYPAMFEEKPLILSLNIAKMYVFAACLSDLAIYAVAVGLHGQPVPNDAREALARRCYDYAMRENSGSAPEQFSAQDCVVEFDRRLGETDWSMRGREPDNFTASPRALFRWAPIADKLKKFDAEIIENSVKYAWRDIREQYRKRIDAAALAADWARLTPL